MNSYSSTARMVDAIIKRARVLPNDLRPSERYDVSVGLSDTSDGCTLVATRARGYAADMFFKTDATTISGRDIRTAGLRGDRQLVDLVVGELEHLARRMRLATKPPKGWRLFSRRRKCHG